MQHLITCSQSTGEQRKRPLRLLSSGGLSWCNKPDELWARLSSPSVDCRHSNCEHWKRLLESLSSGGLERCAIRRFRRPRGPTPAKQRRAGQ